MYVGEARGVYKVAGNLADSKAEFMLLAEPYGSGACAQVTLWPSPAVDWDSCIVGEGL